MKKSIASKLKFFLSLLLLFSCNNDENRCESTINCTTLLLPILINVNHENGEPAALDEYYAINLVTNKIYDFQNPEDDKARRETGSYLLISDAEIEEIPFDGAPFVFIGKINGKEVIKESYVVGKDCCHIFLISGDREIVI
jgi:hypothetical protein